MMHDPTRRLPPAPRPERKPVRVGRELWWHVIETAVIVLSAVLFGAWLLPASVPLWELSGILGVLSGVVWLVTLRITGSAGLSGWLACWGLFLTVWFTAARMIGPWTADMLGALVLGFVILTPFGPPVIANYHALGNRDAEAEARARRQREMERWVTKFSQLGIKGIRITEVRRHANGIQVYGMLGKATDEHGVVTFDRLRDLGPELATDLRLAADAATFEQPDPDNSAAFIMSLRTRKGKRSIVFLPERTRWTSVNEPLELGLHDNGRPFRLLLREIAVMIIGVVGSGKSNLLNAFIGNLAWCEDDLIFAIDLKGGGGRMTRPWMMPWVEDPAGIRRPVLDWVATTRTEAKLMLETLIAAGDVRGQQGAGGEKITPRRNLPGITLVMDETVVATGHGRKDEGISSRELAVLIARLIETYRSEAFTVVFASVRGDVETMGLSAIKAQVLARIGLRVSQSDDARSVFPDDNAHAKLLAKIQDEGAGLALVKGKMSSPVHFYRVTPKLAYHIARQTGPRRPVPDPHLETALGEAYAERWERMEPTLELWRSTAAEWKADPDVGIYDDPAAAPRPVAVLDPPAGGGSPGGRHPGGGADDMDAAWRDIVDRLEGVEDSLEGKVHPARRRMRELLFRAGEHGLTVGTLSKTLTAEAGATGNPELRVHRATLHAWLADDEGLGRVRRSSRMRNDPYNRWVWVRQAGDAEPLADDDPGRNEEDDL